MIVISCVWFFKGVVGMYFDVLVCVLLWVDGFDFDYGIGYGVGVYLCVYEGL